MIRRPSSGLEFFVKNPTPLIMATAEWYTEILEYLASYDIALGDVSEVLDRANNPSEYGDVPPLCLAAMTGKLRMVQALVKRGAEINQRTSIGDSAFFEACFEGHTNVAQFLVQQGANIELANFKKITPLMIASYANNFQIVKMLVSLGADLSKRDEGGRNALFYCVPAGNLTTMLYLLENGGKIQPDNYNMNALMEAAHHGHFEMVKHFVQNQKKLGFSKNDFDNKGRNVLFYACEGGHVDIFQYLITEGVTIHPAEDGSNVLMVATLKGHRDMVEYFVENAAKIGVDINKRDNRGRNSLFYAVSGGQLELFDYLVAHGVKIVTSDDGVNLFIQAAGKGNLDFTKHLLEKAPSLGGIDIHGADKDGWNALLFAVASGNLELFEYLCEAGIEPKTADKDGRTILMQAVLIGEGELLEHLLNNLRKYSLDIKQLDSDGWNVLYYCIDGENVELFRRLHAEGALPTISNTGRNLLMVAAEKRKLAIVKYLLENSDDLDIDIESKDADDRNAVFYACAGGDVEILKLLIESGGSIETDKNGVTVLMEAAKRDHLELMRYLVERENVDGLGFFRSAVDSENRTALFYAVECDSVDGVRELIDADVESPVDKNGKTLLMLAAATGDVELLSLVLDAIKKLNIDKNACDSNGENALHYGFSTGNADIVKLLLHSGVRLVVGNAGKNIFADSILKRDYETLNSIMVAQDDLKDVVNHPDDRGRTCFHHCVEMADLRILKKIAKYYDPNCDRDKKGTTALMISCYKNNLDLMGFLLEDLYVDASVKDDRGMNVLLHAVQSTNLFMVKYLLAHGVLFAPDASGRTAIMIASIAEETTDILLHLVRYVFRGQTTINDSDSKHQTALQYAVKHDRDEKVQILADYGADVNTSDADGVTSLMIAVRRRNFKIVEILLKSGAKHDSVDTRGRTALHYCFEKEMHVLGVVKCLIEFGADVNKRDDNGTTPLMLAVKYENVRPIKLLIEKGADIQASDNQGKKVMDYCPKDRHIIRVLLQKHQEMNKKQRQILEQYRTTLETSVEADKLLPYLVDQGMLSRAERREIGAAETAKMAALLRMLTKKGPRAFDVLCTALEKDHEGLAYDMTKAARPKKQSSKNEFYV